MFVNKNLSQRIKKQGLGIALGGGSVRGFFHIGVLQALEEFNIPIRYITGISIGSLIGGLYAFGYKSHDILQILDELFSSFFQLLHIGTLSVTKKGFLSGKNLTDKLNALVKNKKIEESLIPFMCRAVNLDHFHEEIFSQGNFGEAIKSSCSIPGVIATNNPDKDTIVDGCVMGSVPIELLTKNFNGPSLAVNLFSYKNLSKHDIKILSTEFEKELLHNLFPFSHPVLKSYFILMSYITELEYKLYKPSINVEFNSFYFPTVTNRNSVKDQLISDGYNAMYECLVKHNII